MPQQLLPRVATSGCFYVNLNSHISLVPRMARHVKLFTRLAASISKKENNNVNCISYLISIVGILNLTISLGNGAILDE